MSQPPTHCCTPPQAIWPFSQALVGVQLWQCNFEPAAFTAAEFAKAGIDTPAHILRAINKRQSEFLAGRLCARSALQQLNGHPEVPGLGEDLAPVWPQGSCGSISHSNGWAAAVAARQTQWQGLGLDCEGLLSDERASRLAGEILTPDELLRLTARPATEHAWLVSLTFSAKESLFKALYPLVQKRFYFQDAELLHWDAKGKLQLRLLTNLSDAWPAGSLIDGQHASLDQHILTLLAVPIAKEASYA